MTVFGNESMIGKLLALLSATSTGIDRPSVTGPRERPAQPVSVSGRTFGPAVDGPVTDSLSGKQPLGLRGRDDQL